MNVKSFLYPLVLLPGWRTIKQYPAGTIFLDISWSTFAHAGVYIAARVNSDKQSYEVAAVDLHLALHPTLALTSCPSSLTEQAVSIVASIMFTQQQKTTNHLPGSVNSGTEGLKVSPIVVLWYPAYMNDHTICFHSRFHASHSCYKLQSVKTTLGTSRSRIQQPNAGHTRASSGQGLCIYVPIGSVCVCVCVCGVVYCVFVHVLKHGASKHAIKRGH